MVPNSDLMVVFGGRGPRDIVFNETYIFSIGTLKCSNQSLHRFDSIEWFELTKELMVIGKMTWTRKLTLNTPPPMCFHAAGIAKVSAVQTLVVHGGAIIETEASGAPVPSSLSSDKSTTPVKSIRTTSSATPERESVTSSSVPILPLSSSAGSVRRGQVVSKEPESTEKKGSFLQLAQSFTASDVVYLLDLEQWKWTTPTAATSSTVASLGLAARMHHSLVATKNQIFVFGGLTSSQQYASSDLLEMHLTGTNESV